jgi:hypothetical protein
MWVPLEGLTGLLWELSTCKGVYLDVLQDLQDTTGTQQAEGQHRGSWSIQAYSTGSVPVEGLISILGKLSTCGGIHLDILQDLQETRYAGGGEGGQDRDRRSREFQLDITALVPFEGLVGLLGTLSMCERFISMYCRICRTAHTHGVRGTDGHRGWQNIAVYSLELGTALQDSGGVVMCCDVLRYAVHV